MANELAIPEPKASNEVVHHLPPAHSVRRLLRVSDDAVDINKLAKFMNVLWLPEDVDDHIKHAQALHAVELFESLAPSDGAEGMLAMQMVATHDAALECLRRAAIPKQTFEGRESSLKHAQKLMALYMQQLATLNKHRGKSQQTVTVERVNVESGGQPIVGHVETGTRPRCARQIITSRRVGFSRERNVVCPFDACSPWHTEFPHEARRPAFPSASI